MLDELKADLTPGRQSRFSVVIAVEGPSPDMSPALIACAFADACGAPVGGPVPGLLTSTLYGPYLYVGRPGQSGPLAVDFTITPPPGAVSVTLTLHPWRARAVRLIEAIKPADDAAAGDLAAPAMADDPALLGRIEHAVTAGESYDVLARFAGPFTSRTALATVRFEADDGTAITPGTEIARSDAVGPYRYLEADDRLDRSGPPDPSLAQASFAAPPGAVRMTITMMRWTRGQDLRLTGAEIRRQSAPGRCIASGSADLRQATWFAFSAGLRLPGRRDGTLALIDFVFTDAAGNRLTTTADGLRRTAQYQYVTTIPADPLGPVDGVYPLHVAFRPPAGAVRMVWTLRPAAGIAADTAALAGDPAIRCLRPDLALQIADRPGLPCHRATLGASQTDILRAAIPAEPVWAGIARQGYDLLAELVLPVTPGAWVMVSGEVSRAAGGLERADLVVLPLWFDARGQPLTPEAQTGCPASAALGPHRSVTLHPRPDGTAALLAEPFRPPESAACAMLHLVACHVGAGIAVTAIKAAPAVPEDLLGALDITHMSRAQLLQAAEIAELVWDLPARRALYRALATMEPDGAAYAHRAQVLNEQLADLDTGWRPDLAPMSARATDPQAVLHLLKVICPEENSGGAVRSTSILVAQAARGLHPVACLPLAAPHGELSDRPDGIAEIARDGVSVNFLNFPALTARDLPPADLLSFETGLHNRVLRAHRCSLIHAASGFRGYDTALKGLALARANDLPLVYEVRSFHEHTWRPISAIHMGHRQTRLREAQENRCMAEADAVVTISRAMEANLRARGVAAERLFVVPNAIGAAFETLADLGPVARLRRRHGFAGAVAVGYISNFSAREGHRVLLDAFSGLIAAGRDLHLVMVGDGPERDPIAREVAARRLGARVILPGAVDHADIRAWYRAIDLFVVPRIADFASDYVTPLKPFEAMSQLVPVLMSDRPVTPEIAGDSGERAGIFPAGDPAALAAAIADALADPAALAARAAAARDWVLCERVWASVVARYDEVYAAARAAHAERTR